LTLSFNKSSDAKTGKLVLCAKNPFWLDYVYMKFNEQFGTYYKTFAEKQKKVPARKQMQWALEQGIPLSVYLETEKGWEFVDYFNVIGPMASRDLIMPVDVSVVKGENVNIKLECGFMFWEIDYAAMDFSENTPVAISHLSPSKAIDEKGNDVGASLSSSDNQYLIQPDIGNEVIVKYTATDSEPSQQQTIFLHSRGHYESITDYKGKPNFLYINSFKKKGALIQFSKQHYSDLIDGKARDFDAALLAQDRERTFEIPGARGGRRLDDAQRAIAEFQRRDRGVLGFDFCKCRDRARMDADDVAEKPFQHIDMMTGLVAQHAAIIGPGAAPGILVLISLVPAPAHADGAEDEPPEPAGLQCLARLDDGHVETVLLDDEQLDAGLVAGPDHGVGILQAERHRLFDDDVLSGPGARDHMLGMQPAWRQNGNRVDVLAAKEIVDIVAGRNGVFRRDRVGARADGIANRNQLRPIDMMAAQQIGVALGDASASEQAESDHQEIPSAALAGRHRL